MDANTKLVALLKRADQYIASRHCNQSTGEAEDGPTADLLIDINEALANK